ncbi:MAG: YdcH family protein [Rhodospirillaceae bacterium]|jgi:hypothetical protein|nr:YdcH family protein [Rhodospirillaceae bacterium]MBT5940669.1 YdcH family protein [Rhodospirillaceae bacterium]MBT7955948.1 YdcH family protein [Rhodospirillaceae bacterium]
MNEQDRVSVLKSKHVGLEQEIDVENRRPHPDDSVVAELKRQKLRIKDELASMHAL